ncbi:13192_t:CDS:1, partial [Funneliformis caledonium]
LRDSISDNSSCVKERSRSNSFALDWRDSISNNPPVLKKDTALIPLP